MFKKVKVEDAIGLAIAHDLTGIKKGEFKGAKFLRRHIIKAADIEELKLIGKEHVFVGEVPRDCVHEDECAKIIGEKGFDQNKFDFSQIREGKISVIAKYNGILEVNLNTLYAVNEIDDISVCTKLSGTMINAGEVVAAGRIIPFYTKRENMNEFIELLKNTKICEIKEFKKIKTHLIIMGSEIFKGTIEDKSEEAIKRVLEKYNSELIMSTKVSDDLEMIKSAINTAIKNGAELIICTGGMSVDADDLTPIAIQQTTDKVIRYGAPSQPGNMFMMAYSGVIPIIGVSASVIFHQTTVLNVVLPQICIGKELTNEFFIKLSNGGLCHFCKECHYPNCTYGKGVY